MISAATLTATQVADFNSHPFSRLSMRFTSLIIELIRARPQLLLWLAVLSQALLWFVLPLIAYSSPPADVAMLLAYGREFPLGSDLGPPLAFWLGEIAFRAAGSHLWGVYLLAQLCAIVTFWALFRLGSLIVGPRHALLAVLLTMTVTAFSHPGVEFGPDVLTRPLWALLLLHVWQIIGRGRRNAWFALSIDAGLLLLTTDVAPLLILFVLVFALLVSRGRRMLLSLDPWFSLLVVAVLSLPYLIWLGRGGRVMAPAPLGADLLVRLWQWPELIGWTLLGLGGIAALVVANSRRWVRDPEDAPIILRLPVEPVARHFVFFFALFPLLVTTLLTVLLDRTSIVGGAGTMLLMSGLAAIVASDDIIYLRRQKILRMIWMILIMLPALGLLGLKIIHPWSTGTELATSFPASEIGEFFGDNFERRNGRRLPAVAGDPALATMVAFAARGRPHLFLDATPERTPWIDQTRFAETGGIVVWRAADTAGTPPEDINRHFPGLVPEVPRNFPWQIRGRQPPLLVGWAIVRPAAR